MKIVALFSAAALAAVIAAVVPARADFFVETAVQTHRGTHLDDPDQYQGNGVFSVDPGVGQTSDSMSFDFVDDQVLGPPPGIPIREESALGSASLASGELHAHIAGAQRSDIFASPCRSPRSRTTWWSDGPAGRRSARSTTTW